MYHGAIMGVEYVLILGAFWGLAVIVTLLVSAIRQAPARQC